MEASRAPQYERTHWPFVTNGLIRVGPARQSRIVGSASIKFRALFHRHGARRRLWEDTIQIVSTKAVLLHFWKLF
jgi:hypothetical protein